MKKRDIFLAIFILVALFFTASDYRNVGKSTADTPAELQTQTAQ